MTARDISCDIRVLLHQIEDPKQLNNLLEEANLMNNAILSQITRYIEEQ